MYLANMKYQKNNYPLNYIKLYHVKTKEILSTKKIYM